MTTTTARPSDPSKATGMDQPAGSRSPRPRTQPIDPHSARTLALLTRQPVTATPIPRVHVGPRGADGTILVDDRATDRTFLVYTPRRDCEFRAGHRAGLWYVRTSGHVGPSPSSPGFPSADAAIETIRSPRIAAPRPRCRVLWS